MADPAIQPTEDDVRRFVQKLDEFRGSLNDPEKRCLNAMTTAALSSQGYEVEGFAAIADYGPLLGLIAAALPIGTQVTDRPMTPPDLLKYDLTKSKGS
jgi:hypothetical protein